ncbi:MAG: WbqC family protein [Actinomycetota bacterium]|nr:WbqC family protein [Actinomycetota bacterium]
MQPYFFPNLSHYALIANSDFWIVFDVTQYTPKSWITRNRLATMTESDLLFSVALENSSRNQVISDLVVRDLKATYNEIIGKLSTYSRYGTYYKEVVAIVKTVFESTKSNSLVDLNVMSLAVVCDYLGVPFSYQLASAIDFDRSLCKGPGLWAPIISSYLGAREYLNPVGGRELFDKDEFSKRDIRLYFLAWQRYKYETKRIRFQYDLSILDTLMWCNAVQVRDAIETCSNLILAD